MPDAADQQVANRAPIQTFFQKLADFSAQSLPKGPNAANDYWRKNTFEDKGLKEPLQPPEGAQKEIQDVYHIYNDFKDDLIKAFDIAPYGTNPAKTPKVLIPAIKDLGGPIIKVLGDVWDIFMGKPDARAAAIAAIQKDFEELIKKINAEEYVTQGEHANGHLSEAVQKVAEKTSNTLSNIRPGTATDAGRLADTLRVVCEQLKGLSTKDHDPWLLAQWQVSYQGIMQAAATAMKG